MNRLASSIGGTPGTLILGLCVLAGSALGLLIVPRAPSPPAPSSAPPALIFLDHPLTIKNDAQRNPATSLIEQAQEQARALLDRTFTVTVPGRSSLALPLSKWGVSIDDERLKQLILDSIDPTSPQNRQASDQKKQETTRHLPLVIELDKERAFEHLSALKEATDSSPQSARFDVRKQMVMPDTVGSSLDILGTMFALERAVTRGETKITAKVIVEKPSKNQDALKQLSFPRVLGHFETRYSQSENAADRTFNLRLAAERLDGTVLFPGEIFDFNAVVGPRDEAHGYKVATVIADGELVDGIGGGTCQISGTLHGAVFFSGLEIIERYPHTRPSSYIKMGMDATVVYPTINFRFKNPFEFPIVIHQIVEGGRVYAEVRGQDVDQVVSLIRRIDSAIPYEEVERPDSRLPQGARLLAQRGVSGFRLHRYRTTRRGSHTVREKWRDVYPPTAQVIRVGTGDASLKVGSSTSAPEYTADEVLILTLKRSDDGSPGEFAENREAGKYGRAGWTRELGMPFWENR